MRYLLPLLLAVTLVSVAPAASTDRIVHGQPSPAGAYPWFASLQVDQQDGSGPGHWCGGSLVAPGWVLSAAHCVVNDATGQPEFTTDQLSVILDTIEWADPSQGEHIAISEVVVHPDYEPASKRADLVLFRLERDSSKAPVRLAGAGDVALNAPPTVGRVVGFGDTRFEANEPSPILLEVDLPVVSDAECNETQDGTYIIPEIMVCAGRGSGDPDNPAPDSCQGDSGGPLFIPEEPVQFGVVSFGADCGITAPGVYVEVTAFHEWITGHIAGQGDPDPGEVPDDPLRIGGDDPVANAVAISQRTFQPGEANWAILAASSKFPDALGGSALAGYGPLLYVDAAGQLTQETLLELHRSIGQGGLVYVLGGGAAVPDAIDGQLEAEGFQVVRLAGAGRQQTAAAVADAVREVIHQSSSPPFDSVIVAFEGNWPDAVAVGQISAWFGIPVLLTPRDTLGAPAAAYLQTHQPSTVLVLGGQAVISDAVRQQIRDVTGPDSLVELAGPTRIGTSAAMTNYHREVLLPQDVFGNGVVAPSVLAVVNLRRDDAFAHVLAGSSLLGWFSGVFVTLEGSGTTVEQVVLDSVCGLDTEVLVIGSPALVSDGAAEQVRQAVAGQGCSR